MELLTPAQIVALASTGEMIKKSGPAIAGPD